MGTAKKAKDKAKAKVAAKKAKVKAKACARAVVAVLAVAVAVLCGCATSDSAQPAKSQTQTNTFDDCNFFFAGNLVYSNGYVNATGGNLPTLEMLTQTQSLESSGTESFAQTATQTPTTDVKPQTDLRYNDALSAASTTSKGILETLTQTGMEKVLGLMSSGGTGTVTVEKKDGTQAVVTCENGQCTTCTDCTPSK